MNSAVVELLALASAISIVQRKFLKGELPDFTGVTFLVDNTAPFTSHVKGRPMTSDLRLALEHVIRNASKLLRLPRALRVSHKGLYGYGKKWPADMLASQGRKQRWAWEDPKPPESPVIFDDFRYGFLASKDGTKSLLVDLWVLCPALALE